MTSSNIITYKNTGFDNEKYKKEQIEAIKDRMSKFSDKLYFEIGGKFTYDPHAARVLPGFDPKVKIDIFNEINVDFELIFCLNAQDIVSDRMLSNKNTSYIEHTKNMLKELEDIFHKKPKLSINLIDRNNQERIDQYINNLKNEGYSSYKRYVINGYPNPDLVISKDGYGKDEYIPTESKLVLVVGAASNSGKMSTCLGQIYHDKQKGRESGYAKYETFPIWNISVNHPVNLAYEAATVDIGDFNMVDKYHLYSYGITSVNYNRDVAAFPIVRSLAQKIVSKENFISKYKSPTDMGINTAKSGIMNDEIVAIAGYREILRRKDWYYELKDIKPQAEKWSMRCEQLSLRARKYIETHKYNLEIEI